MAATSTCIYTYHTCTYYLLLFTERYSASLISAKSSSMTFRVVAFSFEDHDFADDPRRSPLHLLEFHRLPRRTASSQSKRDERAKFWDTSVRWLVKFFLLYSFRNLLFLDSRLFRVVFELVISSWLDPNGTNVRRKKRMDLSSDQHSRRRIKGT